MQHRKCRTNRAQTIQIAEDEQIIIYIYSYTKPTMEIINDEN